MLVPLLVALLTGASVFLIILGLSGVLQTETEDVSERIARYGTRQADFLGVRGLAAIVLGALPGILLFLSGAALVRVIGFAVGFGLLGFLLPGIWINRKIQDRRKEILKTLPDALDLMTISVEAGLGFDQAMSKVAEKWGDNELAKEFNRVITRHNKHRSRCSSRSSS